MPWPGPSERSHDRGGQNSPNHTERRDNRHVNEVLEQHLPSDEYEDERQSELEIDKLVDDAREQEIERPQSHHGADVRGIDDEGITRDGEYRGDRISGKNDVGGIDNQQDDKERSGRVARPSRRVRLANEEAIAMIIVRYRNEAAGQASAMLSFRV